MQKKVGHIILNKDSSNQYIKKRKSIRTRLYFHRDSTLLNDFRIYKVSEVINKIYNSGKIQEGIRRTLFTEMSKKQPEVINMNFSKK